MRYPNENIHIIISEITNSLTSKEFGAISPYPTVVAVIKLLFVFAVRTGPDQPNRHKERPL